MAVLAIPLRHDALPKEDDAKINHQATAAPDTSHQVGDHQGYQRFYSPEKCPTTP